MGEDGSRRGAGDVVFQTDELLAERQAEGEEVRYRFFGRARSSDPSFIDRLGKLRGRIAAEEGRVSLDLTGLEKANSAFIGLIVGLVAKFDEKGSRLTLVGPSREVKDLLAIVGILDALDIRDV